ncbi:hypothetical protein MMC16_007017 [Acarospora aff. strigata]|nr:hypothetical protein [Acarospora aff. strigata]
MPFRFLDLGPEVRKKILKEALIREYLIRPYYNNGSLETTEPNVQNPNYETSLLLASKQINQEAADVLYGHNIFIFTQPRPALWFFRHIGPSNLSKLRRVGLVLSSVPLTSLALGSTDTKPFDVVEERLWRELLAWLTPRQRFQVLEIDFEQWRPLPARPRSYGCGRTAAPTKRVWNHIKGYHSYEPEALPVDNDSFWLQRQQMQNARDRVVEILRSWRGLEKVWINGGCKSGAFATAREMKELIGLMKRGGEMKK